MLTTAKYVQESLLAALPSLSQRVICSDKLLSRP